MREFSAKNKLANCQWAQFDYCLEVTNRFMCGLVRATDRFRRCSYGSNLGRRASKHVKELKLQLRIRSEDYTIVLSCVECWRIGVAPSEPRSKPASSLLATADACALTRRRRRAVVAARKGNAGLTYFSIRHCFSGYLRILPNFLLRSERACRPIFLETGSCTDDLLQEN